MKNERGVSLISLIIAILVLLLIAGVIIALAVNKKVFVNNENNTIETVNTVEENKPAENNA
jgi:flagellar basal body-associated protein FliL